MSKHSLLLAVADDLCHLADDLRTFIETEAGKPELQNTPSLLPPSDNPPATLEQVRAVLADKS